MLAQIKEFFAREPINTGRQKNIDLVKALAIFLMVMCHTVMFISTAYESFWYEFADVWMGSITGVAHAFMICMGVGMMFTKKNKPLDYIKRGGILLVLAYVLNFLRGGALCMILGAEPALTIGYMLTNDILQFAALANIVVGLLKLANFKSYQVFVVGLILSFLSTFIKAYDFGNYWANVFIGYFIPTVGEGGALSETLSTFSFINWFVFVGAGMFLGDIIKRVNNLDKLYKWFTIVGGFIGLGYVVPFVIMKNTTGIYYFNINSTLEGLSSEAGYYAIGLIDVIGLLGVDAFLFGIAHFIGKKVNLKFLTMTANNITVIYFIHWCFVGTLSFLLHFVFEIELAMWLIYLIGVVIYFISAFLSIPVSKLIKRIKRK